MDLSRVSGSRWWILFLLNCCKSRITRGKQPPAGAAAGRGGSERGSWLRAGGARPALLPSPLLLFRKEKEHGTLRDLAACVRKMSTLSSVSTYSYDFILLRVVIFLGCCRIRLQLLRHRRSLTVVLFWDLKISTPAQCRLRAANVSLLPAL
ncbi:hypothetical protein EVAR_39855_1 [Eumeta japonica]|uniref:Uncharacterized protein n=1 Tax=Eumeta variegata TaxID=151549 RepID=A0A4C1WR15_EUMVA|nr:hypothetical protein EVAR_39855_1 [Eumeta japonica]